MGFHVVVLAKFKLATHGLSHVVATIACPLVLKLVMVGLRLFRDKAFYSTRLFFFRLGQIAFNTELPSSQGSRLERAFRLLFRIVTTSATAATTPTPFDEDSEIGQDAIHTLSMLTL